MQFETLLSVTLGALVLLRKRTSSEVDFRRLDSLSESELETTAAYDFFNDMFTFGNIHATVAKLGEKSRSCSSGEGARFLGGSGGMLPRENFKN